MFVGVQVAVEGEGWMVRAIDKYFFAYLNVRVTYREKVVKASDIVWFCPSACRLRQAS